jgi:hypothetical protein
MLNLLFYATANRRALDMCDGGVGTSSVGHAACKYQINRRRFYYEAEHEMAAVITK